MRPVRVSIKRPVFLTMHMSIGRHYEYEDGNPFLEIRSIITFQMLALGWIYDEFKYWHQLGRGEKS